MRPNGKRSGPEATVDQTRIGLVVGSAQFQVLVDAMARRLGSELLAEIMPRLTSAWMPNVNTTVDAHDFLARHSERLIESDKEASERTTPNPQRVDAVRRNVTRVLALLDHLNETAVAIGLEMMRAVENTENGTFPDEEG